MPAWRFVPRRHRSRFLGPRRLPELVRRVEANLRNQQVDVLEGLPAAEPEVLYLKHRYVSPEHPRYESRRRFARQAERAGVEPGRFRAA